MSKEEKINTLKEINKKKNKRNLIKETKEINEIKENHDELLKLTKDVKNFLDIYKEYDSNTDINRFYASNINGEIKIANGGITIGFIFGEPRITITSENIEYDIRKEYNSISKYKTNNIDDLLNNINKDMYYILTCLQERLIIAAREFIDVKSKEIEEYIKEEMK